MAFCPLGNSPAVGSGDNPAGQTRTNTCSGHNWQSLPAWTSLKVSSTRSRKERPITLLYRIFKHKTLLAAIVAGLEPERRANIRVPEGNQEENIKVNRGEEPKRYPRILKRFLKRLILIPIVPLSTPSPHKEKTERR